MSCFHMNRHLVHMNDASQELNSTTHDTISILKTIIRRLARPGIGLFARTAFMHTDELCWMKYVSMRNSKRKWYRKKTELLFFVFGEDAQMSAWVLRARALLSGTSAVTLRASFALWTRFFSAGGLNQQAQVCSPPPPSFTPPSLPHPQAFCCCFRGNSRLLAARSDSVIDLINSRRAHLR